MEKIKISFDQGVEINLILDTNKFVQKWRQLLIEELIDKKILQTDTFSSFFDEEESKLHLTTAIRTVNDFLKTDFISLPTDKEFNDPDFYNVLHQQFERLAGPDWSQPTKLIQIAPKHVRLAIRHINRFCHRLEERPYKILPFLRIEFDTIRRESLTEEDYYFFENRLQKGKIYLDYSTLGKSLYECYQDGLSPDYAGMKMQEHYCANFILNFEDAETRKPYAGFKKWLGDHGIDLNSFKNCGQIPLGHIVEQDPLQSIINCRKIHKITME